MYWFVNSNNKYIIPLKIIPPVKFFINFTFNNFPEVLVHFSLLFIWWLILNMRYHEQCLPLPIVVILILLYMISIILSWYMWLCGSTEATLENFTFGQTFYTYLSYLTARSNTLNYKYLWKFLQTAQIIFLIFSYYWDPISKTFNSIFWNNFDLIFFT